MAQRAKKILQEEGSHRVHAEAWARRMCRRGGAQQTLLVEALQTTWEHVARWPGPDDDPGFRAAIEHGMTSVAPHDLRTMVSSWLTALLASEGVEIELPEPDDWSSWDPVTRRLAP